MMSVYGPVSSWRLGRSLGIDPVCSNGRVCSFDCVYCQLGRGKLVFEREEFISTSKLKEDMKPAKGVEADFLTFSGTGEPTLAKNLGEMADYARSISSLPLAILTNSSLLLDEGVRTALYGMDFVIAKLDASNEKLFYAINRPHKSIKFEGYLRGIKEFRESYSGRFALQMMFIGANKLYAGEMAKIAKEIDPDEIQINTPLRPCNVPPLSRAELEHVKNVFSGFNKVVCVYDAEKPTVNPIDLGEVQKRKRPEP